MGKQISRICTDPLIEYGAEALESIREKKASFALDQVTLDIIISTGIVSNMMSTVDSYYYNSTLAHCVYYGSAVTEHGHHHLHGEVVSLGVLCLLEFEKNDSEVERIMKFNSSIGLPVCFDDVEIDESEFEKNGGQIRSDNRMGAHALRRDPRGLHRSDEIAQRQRPPIQGGKIKYFK